MQRVEHKQRKKEEMLLREREREKIFKKWIKEGAIGNACMHTCSAAQSCLTLCNPMDCSQCPLSMEFSRQEYWLG